MFHQVRKIIGPQLVLALTGSLLTCHVDAATASRPGGSGMTWMRTADTLYNGELVIYDQLGVDSYVILNSNLNDFDTFNSLGVNYGLFDPLELGIQTTYMTNDQHNTAGIRSYKGIIKLRLLGDKDKDGYAVTVSSYKTASPTDVANKIGSGSTEDGTEINASYYGEDVNVHLTFGAATADSKYYSPDVVYYSVEKQYANLGVEFKVSDRFIFGIETIQEKSENVEFDKNQIFAFSLQYKANKHWDFDFGASFGVPEDRSEPAKSFYVGFNYRLDERRAPAARRSSPIETRVTEKVTSIPVPESQPEAKPTFTKQPKAEATVKPAPKKSRASHKFKVTIKNATGSSATGERVANFLREKGYAVASIQSVARRNKTEIRYLNKNSQQALQLAIKLPGNQDLRKMSSLDKGIDFEIVIGSDMVQSIR